ncbi:MAG: septum formation initiator family protein [Bacteroidales bacterium]|nr:septum formation initiator family protein [Candidatus Cryptobacteroides equifaecalis]
MSILKDIWNKEKDGNKVAQRSFMRYAIVITVVFALFMFLKKDSVLRWIQAGYTLSRQQKQIELYKEQNNELDRRIRTMRSDRDTLETFAREEFFFCAPGEDVYITE